jgi:hypothetical protein
MVLQKDICNEVNEIASEAELRSPAPIMDGLFDTCYEDGGGGGGRRKLIIDKASLFPYIKIRNNRKREAANG